MAIKKLYLHFPVQTAIPVLGTTAGWTTNQEILDRVSPDWYEACAVDVSFDGSWEEEDTTDSCSNEVNESAPTTRNSEISFDHFFKLASDGGVPTWIKNVQNAWENKEVILAMMLNEALDHVLVGTDVTGNGAKSSTLYDGIVMAANIFGYTRAHPTKGSIKLDYTLKAAGTVQLSKKLLFISDYTSTS
jgi:hypothetical protein